MSATSDRTQLPAPDVTEWRTEVGRFRAAEQRRVHPLWVQIGVPAGDRVGIELFWPEPTAVDAGMRFDVLMGLLGAYPGDAAHCWVTRPGVPELHDVDHQWYAAAKRAFAAADVGLSGFHVVTRTGWLDILTGERRTWKRLRL